MLEVHLFGKLRHFAENKEITSESVVNIPFYPGDTIQCVVERIGIPLKEIGNNIFLNGEYSALARPVADGDRLGIFPDDMQLLYKWWFTKTGEVQNS